VTVIGIRNEAVPFSLSKAISLNCCPMKVYNCNLNVGNHVNIFIDLQYICQKINVIMRYSSSVDFVVVHSPIMDA
jgi:hypothetical protein